MAKKYVILFIASISFLGLLRVGFCQSVNSKASPACCLGKSHSSDNEPHHSAQEQREDCFSHCFKQNVVTVKINSLLREDLKTKIPLFSGETYYNPQSYLFSSSLLRDLNQINAKLNISHIYFVAIFNHAPPFLFH